MQDTNLLQVTAATVRGYTTVTQELVELELPNVQSSMRTLETKDSNSAPAWFLKANQLQKALHFAQKNTQPYGKRVYRSRMHRYIYILRLTVELRRSFNLPESPFPLSLPASG